MEEFMTWMTEFPKRPTAEITRPRGAFAKFRGQATNAVPFDAPGNLDLMRSEINLV